jgi:endonuclease/exonuclease/phosphatase family metal-dependent hydrolase
MFRFRSRSAQRRVSPVTFRPRVEPLEDRSVPSAPAPGATAPDGSTRDLTVMTRNLYAGADFRPLFDPSAPGGPIFQASLAWNEVKQNNFPLRAEALADEVAANHPDLIGLTEVSAWYSGPADGGPFGGLPATTVEYDYLAILRGALRERSLHYGVVAEVKTFDEELPLFPDLTRPLLPANMKDFRLIDREVILARTDLATSQMKLSNVRTGHFVAQQSNVLTVPGFPPVVLESDLGWASVDVKVRGKEVRFIGTHLEPEETGAATQVAQAAELLAGPANTRMPVILTGDLNSRADGTGTASHANIIAAGFEDAWSAIHPHQLGYTYGHEAILNNRDDGGGFDRRIDYVLYRGDLDALASDVVGEETADFDRHGIWASDHAGVVATIGIHVRPEQDLAAVAAGNWGEDLGLDGVQAGDREKVWKPLHSQRHAGRPSPGSSLESHYRQHKTLIKS